MYFNGLDQRMHEAGLSKEWPCVIGFSGGPDSFALLNALHGLGWPLVIAHLDHGLRPESAADAIRAKQQSEVYNFPFVTERAEVSALVAEGGLSVEEAGRNARYEFLFRVAQDRHAQAVVVAHNADDQSETVLMHLLRGAGSAGLRGMALRSLPNSWSTQIPLVRPLLGISRTEILNYCQLHGLNPILDASNNDPAYFRNKLRHEVLPALERVAPGIRLRLQHSAELLAADYGLIEHLAQEAWRRCLAERGPDFVGLDRAMFLAEPLALQRALLRRAAAELRPLQRDVDFRAIELALQAINKAQSAPQDWLAGLCILVEGDRIWLADWDADLPVAWPQIAEDRINIKAPGTQELNNGWRFTLAEDDPNLAAAESNTDRYQAWFDLDVVGDDLELRRAQPGDKVQLLGMQGSQSLADLFTNAKLPRRARAAWPLLSKGADIVWVPGLRVAHPFRLQPASRRALHAHLQRVA